MDNQVQANQNNEAKIVPVPENVPMTQAEFIARGKSVGLFSNFTEGDILNLERQAHAKSLNINANSTNEEIANVENAIKENDLRVKNEENTINENVIVDKNLDNKFNPEYK